MPTRPELRRLQSAHGQQLLAFETVNRAWFAQTISDRGDAYFERFAEELDDRLAEQEAGRAATWFERDVRDNSAPVTG